jgi:hypothetical protein
MTLVELYWGEWRPEAVVAEFRIYEDPDNKETP